MAFTQEQTEALEEAYAAGELTVRHGDKSITYASMGELRKAILHLRTALAPAGRRYKSGRVRFARW